MSHYLLLVITNSRLRVEVSTCMHRFERQSICIAICIVLGKIVSDSGRKDISCFCAGLFSGSIWSTCTRRIRQIEGKFKPVQRTSVISSLAVFLLGIFHMGASAKRKRASASERVRGWELPRVPCYYPDFICETCIKYLWKHSPVTMKRTTLTLRSTRILF